MKKLIQIIFVMVLIAFPVFAEDPDVITVTSSGDVGIGNPNPRVKLDVNGRIMDQDGYIIPVGTILPYGGATAPAGWLLCDGTAYNRAGAYAELFNVINTAFGAPDTGKFNVPDLRGQFLRGVNNGSGTDPEASSRTALKTGGNTGDKVGSKQGDITGIHGHSGSITVASGDCETASQCQASGIISGSKATSGPSGVSISSSGGAETRPRNVNVNFIIKY